MNFFMRSNIEFYSDSAHLTNFAIRVLIDGWLFGNIITALMFALQMLETGLSDPICAGEALNFV